MRTEPPHTRVGSLGESTTHSFPYQGPLSCLYDDLRPTNLDLNHQNDKIMPRFDGGWCVSHTGERLFHVVAHLEAGRLTVQNAQRRHFVAGGPCSSPSEAEHAYPPAISQSRDHRSARTVIDFAVANELKNLFTLQYEQDPISAFECSRHFDSFVRRIRYLCGSVPWVQVLERGTKSGRLHHHVLAPSSVKRQVAEELWPFGYVHASYARSVGGIRRKAGYMCKNFAEPAEERLGSHRYRISRTGVRPRARSYVLTQAEIDQMLSALAPGGAQTWYPAEPLPFHCYSKFWNPHI